MEPTTSFSADAGVSEALEVIGASAYGGDWERSVGAILEDLSEAVVLLDADGLIRTWNAAAAGILGYAPDEILGRPSRTLVPPDRVGDLERIASELLRYGRVQRLDTAALAKDGEAIPVSLTQTRLVDANGKCAGYTLILRDLRERENLQRQLLRADRLATIGLLASTVAHEVGTPLNVILGRAELLEQTLADNDPARRQIATIAKQIQRISDVVSRLLMFSREASPGNETVHINVVIDEVVLFIEPRLRAQGVALERDLQPDLPSVSGSPGHFHQVFLNLVMNALDAMPDGGQLKLRTRACVGRTAVPALELGCHCLQAEVTDTGPGIAASVRKKIFEPFFTTKKGGKGTGLGLAISEEIVRKYRGQLHVRSEIGEGTTFLVNLPVPSTCEKVVR